MKRLVSVAFVVACTATAVPAFGAERQGNARAMETVVVTAGRVEEKARNVSQAVTVIPREELEKDQYQDLGRMLRNYGFQVNSYTGNEGLSQISIRGLRTPLLGEDMQSPILVMVDGRRVGTSNISMIPMVNIERVEIIRGPASVQYGASAIGGVINIITRRGTKDWKISAEAGLGSWETYKTQAALSGASGPVDFSGGVSYLTIRDDYNTGNGQRYRNTETNYRTAYSLNLGLNFLDEHRIGFSALGVRNDNSGAPGAFKSDYASDTALTERGNHSVDFVYDGGYRDYGLTWQARYYNGKDNYLSDDPGEIYYDPYWKTTNEFQGAQGQLSFNYDFLTLTGGVDWLKSKATVKTLDQENKYDNIGVFLLGKAALFDEKIIVSAGVRYDKHNLEYEGRDTDFDRVTPSLGVAWHALDWLTVRSNYGESYRVPQSMELMGYDDGWGTIYHGNPDLNPERGRGWDVGFDANWQALNFGLTYFQIDYKDKIAARSYGNSGEMEWYNMSGTVKYQGLEANADYDVGHAFDWPFMLKPYVSLTHMLRYEDQDGNQVPYVSNMDLGYGLSLNYPDIGLEADLRFTYMGHQKIQEGSETVSFGGDTVADFFVSKTLFVTEDAGKISVKAEVRNLFDVAYATIKGYPMPGRSFYIGLRYEY